jgi:peroxiredoxin
MTSSPTIAEQSTTFLVGVATQARAHVVSALTNNFAALDAHGVPAGVPPVGATLPAANLLDVHGSATTLASARADKPAVLIFYRGAWCPFCNIAFKTYQAELVPALDQLGVQLIAISPQKPDGSMSMQQTHSLAFTLLSDPANALAANLGIVSPAQTPDVQAAVKEMGTDIAAANIDGTEDVPMPTAIVVDAGGRIRSIDVHPNFTTRSEVADIVNAVRRELGE